MIKSLSPRLQRGLAVGLLLLAILLVWVSLIQPVVSLYLDASDQENQLVQLLTRLKTAASEKPQLEKRLSVLEQAQQQRTDIMEAANSTLATATLQSEVKQIIESAGGRVRSMQPLNAVSDQGFQRISVGVDVECDTVQLGHTLYVLESHQPAFLIGGLIVRANEQLASANPPKDILSVHFNVNAFTRSPS